MLILAGSFQYVECVITLMNKMQTVLSSERPERAAQQREIAETVAGSADEEHRLPNCGKVLVHEANERAAPRGDERVGLVRR